MLPDAQEEEIRRQTRMPSEAQHPLARTLVTARTWPFLIDLGVAACALAVFFAVVSTGAYWLGKPVPVVPISHSLGALPLYAFYSIVRIGIAYLLSLIFAVTYGYIAAYNPRIEAWMIAVLDILQSIPVLSFLPPVVLAMVALIPGHQMGIEMGVILLIFTGQVWNLAFSFYSSLKSIPREMIEASRIYRYSAWQRFWQLEMPYAAIGLVWNSIVSVAGGWFALMACEMFTMGDRNFQLPGLGSYLQTAADSGDIRALVAGFAVVILIVVATDQLVWRPLIAWSDKFKFEQVESADRVTSPDPRTAAALNAAQHSARSHLGAASKSPSTAAWRAPGTAASFIRSTKTQPTQSISPGSLGPWPCRPSPSSAGAHCRPSSCSAPSPGPTCACCSKARAQPFSASMPPCSSLPLWTIPVGVAIGFNPKLARIVQPIAQVLASVPATAFFPILLIGLVKIGGGLGIGSIALMLLGTQWYILFNVIAGAMSIPSDLREVSSLYPLHPLAALDHAHPPRHLPLPHHRHGHRLRRRLERLGLRRVLPHAGPHLADHRPGRADRRRHRQRPLSRSCCSPPS